MTLRTAFLRNTRFFLALALLLATVSPAAAAEGGNVPDWRIALPAKDANQVELEQKVQAAGSLPVIVMLDARFQPEGGLASSSVMNDQRLAIQVAQDSLLGRLGLGYLPQSVKHFASIPFLALSVTPGGLAALEADGQVLNIEPDAADLPTLAESVPLIGAPAMWDAGYTGAGQVIAVLDTGVDKNHPFLAGKVVSEACYSTSNVSVSSRSICSGGVPSSTEIDSALPYASGICPPDECDHGTHVAGIAAGHAYDNAQGTAAFNGVAKDAGIIAIQVFSAFPANYCSSASACVMSYTSDQILGMERVLELRTSYNIAAVNFSLGGGQYDEQEDCDQDNPARKAVIDNLRSTGIATVAAAGNGYYTDSFNAPACISSAISVGSTDDGSGGTLVDSLSSYSNVASFLTLLAPGNAITSSIPGGQFATWSGTSMAAPHAAGAWAVLKQKYPDDTVDQINALLVASGKLVTDNRSWSKAHVTRPRLNLAFAISGRVTSSEGGTVGLAGVTVSAGAPYAAITDSGGNYSIPDLPLGSYTVTPELAAFSFAPGSRDISCGPSQTGVDFSAVQYLFRISGRVTMGGIGLAGVTVSAGTGHSIVTSENGDYVLDYLTAGTYPVIPSLPQYIFAPPQTGVMVGGSKAGIDFAAVLNLYEIHLPYVIDGVSNYSLFVPVFINN